MKFSGRQLGQWLAATSMFVLALPVAGQEPAFTPVSPTYLVGFGSPDLPRADAVAPSNEPAAPATIEQAPVPPTTQISDGGQDPALSAVLQTAFTPKTQDQQQQQLPTVVQQFAKTYEAPAPTVQAARSYESPAPMPAVRQSAKSASINSASLQPAVTSCDATATAAAPAANCAQPACACACACCDPLDHHCGVFAEYLYLRAFDVDMAHGIQQNGTGGAGTVPAGDVGTVQPDFESGFRVGADWACTCCSEVRFTYTWYQSKSTDLLLAQTGIGGTAQSLVLDPGTVDAAATFDSLFATYQINFQTADIDYMFTLDRTECSAWTLSVGARYAHLVQNFDQLGEFTGAGGRMNTSTSILFDGVGLRTGIEGTRECGKSRVFLYGKCFLDVLFGDFRSQYEQFNLTTSTSEASSHWVDGRVMPILETEVGLRWISCDDHWKLAAGYNTAYWFNAVDTAEFIQAVQSDSFTHVGHAIVFTGLVAHAEFDF